MEWGGKWEWGWGDGDLEASTLEAGGMGRRTVAEGRARSARLQVDSVLFEMGRREMAGLEKGAGERERKYRQLPCDKEIPKYDFCLIRFYVGVCESSLSLATSVMYCWPCCFIKK